MKLSSQALAALVLAVPLTSTASCVQEKVDDWVASNNTLYQDLTCNCTMGSDAYKTAAAACSSEIDKYTAAAEESCQLEKEFDSPQNYGDRWLQVVQPYKFMSAPDTNGAAFLDGKYDLGTMFGSSGIFTVLDPFGYPTPEVYKKFCFANLYTGQKLDEEPFSLWPTWTLPAEFGGGPIFDANAAPFITPEMYCNVKWEEIDQAYWDLKICALRTIGEPVNMTKEEMLAIYEAAKKNIKDCSEAMCSSVAAAVSDAAGGETEQAEAENEPEQVDASTKSSDAASVSSFIGTIAAVVVALIYLN